MTTASRPHSSEVSQRATRAGALLLILLAFACAAWVWRAQAVPPPDVPKLGVSSARLHSPERRDRRLGGLDVTFVVASDTHFGFGASEADLLGNPRDPSLEPQGTDLINARSIRAMNALPGRPWPHPFGGAVGSPRGVLVTGDLTENGEPWQWKAFVAYFGLNGDDGLLRYPVFEAHGNHDKHASWYVLDRIRERHGSTRYAFDWDDLHLVCLGEAPDDDGLRWLNKDLVSVGRERPIVLYLHFPLRGPFSDNWFGNGDYRDRLRSIVEGYNVIAVFHGHYHASGRYRWAGYDVYNVGAAKHRMHSFGVVQVTDSRLRVASYHHGLERWEWWHEKPINGAPTPTVSGGTAPDGGIMLADE